MEQDSAKLEAQWVEAICGDDRDNANAAFAELEARYRQDIFDCVQARTGCRDEDAQDMREDVFFTFWKRRGDFHPERGSVRAYLLGIAFNKARTFRQRQAIRPLVRINATGEREINNIVDPESTQARIRQLEKVEGLLESLSDEEREVIFLLSEGYSYQEVADKLSIPPGTVASRRHKAIRRLRSMWLGRSFS
jgi:RNA polymerase sigma-70 factor (ECF subfamily)